VVLAAVGLVFVWTIGGEAETTKTIIAKGAATAAIVLLVPGVFVWKLLSVPPALEAEMRAELEQLRIPLGGPFPDWTIRALFKYLQPADADEAELSWHERVGSAVLDRVTTYRLGLWGRPKRGDDWGPLVSVPRLRSRKGQVHLFLSVGRSR
jgi:hypothetical protein